jgi:hypothetical protein
MKNSAKDKTGMLSGKLNGKLNWYSAMMAGAFLIPASPGIAGVYYSGDKSLAVGGLVGTSIDLDNDGTNDFRLNCYFYSTNTTGLTISSASCYIEKIGTEGGHIGVNLSTFASNLGGTATVSSLAASTWESTFAYLHTNYYGALSTYSSGNFTPGNPQGYIPVRLSKGDGTHYGWIQYRRESPISGTILGWAYETDPGTSISCTIDPTAIELSFFTGQPLPGGVLLEWETASEIDNAGFQIWRSESREGDYELVTDGMIPAGGGGISGEAYEWMDNGVYPGTTYYYKLEDIDTVGNSTLHEPIMVVVPAAIELMGPEDGAVLPRGSRLVFKWDTNDYQRFQLQFSTNGDFSGDVLTLPLPVGNKSRSRWISRERYKPKSKEIRQLKKLGRQADTLYWRVAGKDGREVDVSTANTLTISR